MPFPIIPVVATALVAGLGYAVTRKEEPKKPTEMTPAELLAYAQMQAAQAQAQVPPFVPGVYPGTPPTVPGVMSAGLKNQLMTARKKAIDSRNDTDVGFRTGTIGYLSMVAGNLLSAGFKNEAQELASKAEEISKRPPPFVPGVYVGPGIQPPYVAPPGIQPPYVAPPIPSSLPVPTLEDLLKKLPAPAPVLPPSPVEPTSQTGTVLGTPGANLRGNPSVTAPILIGLVNGTKIKVLDLLPTPTTGAPYGWVRALAPTGQTGYVSKEFVRLDAEPLPGILPAVIPAVLPSGVPSLMATVLGTPGANLRAQPNTSGAIVVGLFNGTKVKVLNPIPFPPTTGAPKGWINVQTQSGQTGYVSAEFLRIEAPVIAGERMFTPGRENNLRRKNSIRS